MLNNHFPRPSMEWTGPFSPLQAETTHAEALRALVTPHYRSDEQETVLHLLQQADHSAFSDPGIRSDIEQLAKKLVKAVRAKRIHSSGVDALMQEFSLSSEEGIALMCLAEALLRIPDRETVDRLIADKISRGDWRRHLGESPSLFVNAAAWGLLITGKLLSTHSEHTLGAAIAKLIAKGGEPLIRKGVDLAMRMLGNQFIAGQTIAKALAHGHKGEARGYRYSYDMLGEAALTTEDAKRYYASYEEALHAIGKAAGGHGVKNGPGMSIKLSALHPRYSRAQRQRVLDELLPRLKQLALLARHYNIGLNIDAEEADRLELSLELVESLAFDEALTGFDGIGIVVQAYQKRCPYVIDYLIELARRSRRKFMVRLVKGAYWDAEIKRAQVDGLPDYPVYTRKAYTDVSYLVCARKLLNAAHLIYPQFATHNAHTLACVHTWARQAGVREYEFQCLHGMGEALYDEVIGSVNDGGLGVPCRIYAPVGSHQTLLAYLVRRLLENGANSSFVNRLVDETVSVESLIADPFDIAREQGGRPHPAIPLPRDLFMQRKNSQGLDLTDDAVLRQLSADLIQASLQTGHARPLIAEIAQHNEAAMPGWTNGHAISNPANHSDIVGYVIEAQADEVEKALVAAQAYALEWQALEPAKRAALLEQAAALFEARRHEFIALAVREAGKSIPNAVAEVREAVDFLRYYALEIRAAQQHGLAQGLAWGPMACISPWNFPLAIFTGQIAAALAAGNVVLAKPAEQTSLIACHAVRLMHEAGIPAAALQLLPGRGETVGAALVADVRVRGVIFTGSTEVAQAINRTLATRAAKEHCELPLIAETGGQNAMIVDSSALPEQVVQDALTSAFDSAGQRCSALRVICLQEEIADKIMAMLRGAMHELAVGNPGRLSTDIGPVIDTDAKQALENHIDSMKRRGKSCFQLPLKDDCRAGNFVAPTMIEIASISELQREVFGPVLHVLRYRRDELPQLLKAINATGYGLTMGIHSRINETIDAVASQAHVGNLYVNRTVVGAVVGVQPFGGEGKSGTGPKAGGPLYLWRLMRSPAGWLDVPDEYKIVNQEKTAANLALAELDAWAQSHDHPRLASLIRQYRNESLNRVSIALPGPTGERNILSFKPKGNILCAAETADALLNQVAAVLACGNTVCLSPSAALLLPDDLPGNVCRLLKVVHENERMAMPVQLVLASGSCVVSLRLSMTETSGAIIPVIETAHDTAVPLWRLVTERAICINTTAAGGNASLMTLRS